MDFSNTEGQKVKFNVNILNLLKLGVTPVNQMMTDMITNDKLELMSHYEFSD